MPTPAEVQTLYESYSPQALFLMTGATGLQEDLRTAGNGSNTTYAGTTFVPQSKTICNIGPSIEFLGPYDVNNTSTTVSNNLSGVIFGGNASSTTTWTCWADLGPAEDGPQILMEGGATGRGAALVYQKGRIHFCRNASPSSVSGPVSSVLTPGPHFIAVIHDAPTATASLYIDNQLVSGPFDFSPMNSQLCGSNFAGFGMINNGLMNIPNIDSDGNQIGVTARAANRCRFVGTMALVASYHNTVGTTELTALYEASALSNSSIARNTLKSVGII